MDAADRDVQPASVGRPLPDEAPRAAILLAGENRLLEMIALGRNLSDILHSLCVLVEEVATVCHCSVLLLDAGGSTVRHAAAPTLPEELCRAIDGRPVAPPYWAACAMAIDRKEQVIVPDIAADGRWATEWRDAALAGGLRSCWTTPILSQGGRPIGTFALYRRQTGGPADDQRAVINQCTHIASIAVERSQAENALRRSEAQLARGQRLSATGSFTYDARSRELTLSVEARRICGLDADGPVSPEAMRDRIHPDDLHHFRGMIAGCERQYAFDCRVVREDGRTRYVQVLGDALRDERGALVEWVGAMRDVTERKAAEDALTEMRSQLAHVARVATLGALTASIAHEVNQPLSGIVTNANTSLLMLGDDPPNLEGARETARRTIRDANRAAQVIARLRALFTRAPAANEPVDLNDAAREVLNLLGGELEREKALARVELADGLPPVAGDRVQLQQVVLNLVRNAAEAMRGLDGPREVVIRTALEGDLVRLSVEDSGPGIDPANARRLFEMLYTTKAGGMGMGLSISRSIVESHRGRLWAEAHPCRGATFAFTVPRFSEGA